MSLISDTERPIATALAELTYANPFLPRRVELERRVLGSQFVDAGAVWHLEAAAGDAGPNVEHLAETAEELVAALGRRLAGTEAGAVGRDRALYRDLALYVLYQRYEAAFFRLLTGGRRGEVGFYERFVADLEELSAPLGARRAEWLDPPHLFACFFQVRRAFHFTFRHILGGSMPAARLRAEVWQSIFTHDLERYLRSLYRVTGDLTTLITGPSGTGKELVARAIGLSRYLPFDPASRRFQEDFEGSFYPLNLSAFSPTLIESELFGHRRGSFTGAIEDRQGFLEVCPPLGTVFLDEIGEVDAAIQVKLLRVIESRRFQRLGETRERRFSGKLVAATNRDLAAEMGAGRFREDLYYRLCADIVRTPSLAERLAGAPEELGELTRFLAAQIVGDEEAAALADEVVAWIGEHLGPSYPWPGNVRELGQCIRNVLVRRRYRPAAARAGSDPAAELARAVAAGELTADELVSRYATLVYARSGSYLEAGRRLGLDRRTVKARVDPALLERLGRGTGRP